MVVGYFLRRIFCHGPFALASRGGNQTVINPSRQQLIELSASSKQGMKPLSNRNTCYQK